MTYVLATMPDENSDTIRLINTPKPAAPTRSRVNKENGASISNQNGASFSNQNGASFLEPDPIQRRQSTQNVSSAGYFNRVLKNKGQFCVKGLRFMIGQLVLILLTNKKTGRKHVNKLISRRLLIFY